MKFSALHVLALCICFGQICSEADNITQEDQLINKLEKFIRDSFHGVDEQFVDDVREICVKYQNESMIVEALSEILVKAARISRDSKIDVNKMRDFYSTDPYISRVSAFYIAFELDDMKIVQSILSKQLPPARYNGFINLAYVYLYKNATSEEIESTLNYLYGIDNAATKTAYIEKFPDLSPTDCSDELRLFSMSDAEHSLKSMANIKPKVIQDFMAIRDKFPCKPDVLECLKTFVKSIKQFQGNASKFDACKIKENPGQWYDYWRSYHFSREHMENLLRRIEMTMSARLTDETYRGILDFERANIPDTSIDEIEKALEYLYDDVPKMGCPVNESSKLETK